MNLLSKKWYLKNKTDEIKIEYISDGIIIENSSNQNNFLIFPKVFKKNKNKNIILKFDEVLESGTACTLKLINRHRVPIVEVVPNSECFIDQELIKYFIVAVYIPPKSKNVIRLIDVDLDADSKQLNNFKSDTLVVTPGYPSLDNKYNCAFVHTRVKAYIENNFKVDVACINDFNTELTYNYDGVNVYKANFFRLRELLQNKQYKRILIHFFDNRFANVLDSVDISNTNLYFYLHGAETLYRDWPKIASPYFGPTAEINDDLEKLFNKKDYYIKKYNNVKNAKWVFVTEWTKKRCEELLNIKFNNYEIIPCLIDTELFSYEEKKPELRKKIFVLRKFDDINSYSLDTSVRVVLELSRRKIFSDLEFDFYGEGSMFDSILEPLKNFENVHFHRGFLNHQQIRKVHENHGIALFPTRFDSQAVSSCEAASSGCAVVSSNIPGVRQFIPLDLNVLCETEDYRQYADVIEKMYYDEKYFLKVAKEESKSVQSKFDFEHTIAKELVMFKNESELNFYKFKNKGDSPLLTIIIPSYNVEKYIKSTVFSLLNQAYAEKLEILIVNDGSKDNTLKIAKNLESMTSNGKRSIVKVIDKENGGHGSTINVGIQNATGKYLKIVDGDDTVDSQEFGKLIEILENENSDIVLTNYVEDFAIENRTNVMKIYSHLKPGIQYHFDDLCNENYGFTSWGPILSCSTYRTNWLKKADFKLSEKIFYVDMELNINVAINCDTITYYDLNVYRYLLGRVGQSVTRESYKRNYKHHEQVCLNMIKIYNQNINKISDSKRQYIINKLIIPMVCTQYEVCISYVKKRLAFWDFDKSLSAYPLFYNDLGVCSKKVKFYRCTHGHFLWLNDFLVRINGFLRK